MKQKQPRLPVARGAPAIRQTARGGLEVKRKVEVMPVPVKTSELFDVPDAQDAYVRVQLGSGLESALMHHARQFCTRVSEGRWAGFLMAPVWAVWLVEIVRDSARRGGTLWFPAESRFAHGDQNVFSEATSSVDFEALMEQVRNDPAVGKALHTAHQVGGMAAVLAFCPKRELLGLRGMKVRKQ